MCVQRRLVIAPPSLLLLWLRLHRLLCMGLFYFCPGPAVFYETLPSTLGGDMIFLTATNSAPLPTRHLGVWPRVPLPSPEPQLLALLPSWQ